MAVTTKYNNYKHDKYNNYKHDKYNNYKHNKYNNYKHDKYNNYKHDKRNVLTKAERSCYNSDTFHVCSLNGLFSHFLSIHSQVSLAYSDMEQ